MNFDKVKGIVGSLAPTLGAALGGPVGGAAASMLADVLGCDPAPQKIERALAQATPEQLAEIKRAELQFETKMKELEVDIFALETADVQDARRKSNWVTQAIGLIMVLFFCGYVCLITLLPPEQNSMELTNLVMGYLGGLISAVISFHFGSSQKQD
tara:strand:- start:1731 stop:2198 length:468 start_codon:yes stop_codon:yes gene_type:complete